MTFHLHQGTMKPLANYVKLQVHHRCPGHCLPSLLKQWAEWIYISNITWLLPFLDGSSEIVAGTMSLHLWLNRLACAQPGWEYKVSLDRSLKGSFRLINHEGNRASQSTRNLPFLFQEALLWHILRLSWHASPGRLLLPQNYYHNYIDSGKRFAYTFEHN